MAQHPHQIRMSSDEFDGDFDPDRVTPGKASGQDLDLNAGAAAEVTPYSYGASGHVPTLGIDSNVSPPPTEYGGGLQMSQQQPYGVSQMVSPLSPTGAPVYPAYGVMPPTTYNAAGVVGGPPPSAFPVGFAPAPSAPSAYSEPSAYSPSEPSTTYPDYPSYANYPVGPVAIGSIITQPQQQLPGATGPQDFRHPSPGPSLALTTSDGQSSSGRGGNGTLPSSKEREAMAERLHVANEMAAGGSIPSPMSSVGSPVMQHMDGGRLDVRVAEAPPPQEIPPSYDSIPRGPGA
ncbi:hypothetical protein NLI96_g11235 [Meripilus lineatus]|uniref:Uncharacterized protein n=1 Tax=Meripilus lineatus TaxID=2056292 RepID=A0AAD5UTP5_9APHY|nr:hypothetical protein NLI96_g11235 [Physisporinus lineatus]